MCHTKNRWIILPQLRTILAQIPDEILFFLLLSLRVCLKTFFFFFLLLTYLYGFIMILITYAAEMLLLLVIHSWGAFSVLNYSKKIVTTRLGGLWTWQQPHPFSVWFFSPQTVVVVMKAFWKSAQVWILEKYMGRPFIGRSTMARWPQVMSGMRLNSSTCYDTQQEIWPSIKVFFFLVVLDDPWKREKENFLEWYSE